MAGFRLPMCMKFAANVPLLSKTPNEILEKLSRPVKSLLKDLRPKYSVRYRRERLHDPGLLI